eukprot:TRINITY_DN18702_c0_g1_i2.p1 TRINITY_DN18702_c0_g1~~TRINITY_DN18702_c0_g1_i2.p1  ORF type:complete len:851 (+),score=70.98 TRINITY_DN18702_c0_g1_i2:69-2621(+)
MLTLEEIVLARRRKSRRPSTGALPEERVLPGNPRCRTAPCGRRPRSLHRHRSGSEWAGGGTHAGRAGPRTSPCHTKALDEQCAILASRLQQVHRDLRGSRGSMSACPILPGQISGGSSISRSLSSYATSKQRHSPALQGKNAPSSWRDHSISTSSSQKQRKEEMTRALADRLEQLQGMVDKLGSVFSSELQIQEIRNTAATRIASVVRMSLVRARYFHMRMVLRHWRVRHSALTMMCIQEELQHQEELQVALDGMASRREVRLKRRCYSMFRSLGTRAKRRRQEAHTMQLRNIARREQHLAEAAFHAWWEAALGQGSGREVARRNKQRQVESRERLTARLAHRGEVHVTVSVEMVKKEMAQEAVALTHRKRDARQKAWVLRVLHQEACRGHEKWQAAVTHRQATLRRTTFECWKCWARDCCQREGLHLQQMGTYTKSAGLRYNMRRVERFARVHCLGPVFMAWSGYSKRHFRATRLQRKHLTLHLKGHFTAWVAAAKRLRSIRAMAIKNWIEESSQNARAYFGAWQRFVQREKQRAADHERLVALCRRSLTRRTTWRIMRAWHHLSVYGRVDGLYSRPQLITALAEEKQHALALGEKAQQLSHSLQEMENLAMDYRRQALARTREVRQCEATAAQTTMALHHAEQDVMRIQSLLDAATTISPPVLNALRNMAPDFNFQERGLTAWARLRAQNSAKAEEDRFQARLAALQLPSTKQLSADGGASSTTAGGATHSMATPGKSATRQLTSPRDIACSPGIDAATQAEASEFDSSAAGAAAIAAAAFAAGIKPPLLPEEVQLLDRTAWVLREAPCEHPTSDEQAMPDGTTGSSGVGTTRLTALHEFLQTGDCRR